MNHRLYIDVLKLSALKCERYMLGNFMSSLSSAEFSLEKIVLKMSFSNTRRVSNNMDPDNAQFFLA